MMKQTEIATRANISQPMVSAILNGKARPSWSLAKRLSAILSIDPVILMEGTQDEIRNAIESADPVEKQTKDNASAAA